MQEKNKHILRQAIQKLPQYEPEDTVWIAIDAELEIREKQNPLQDAIHELPSYQPPAAIWDKIDQELNSDQSSKLRRLWTKRIASLAAVLIFLITVNQLFFRKSDEERVTITYSEEKTEAALFAVDWNDDEDAFGLVMDFCKNQNIVCELPEFKMLKSELEELNDAREELKTALEHYGTDPDLIAQLTSIEHERSDVLKKMIEKI